jgi:hypothetical protein
LTKNSWPGAYGPPDAEIGRIRTGFESYIVDVESAEVDMTVHDWTRVDAGLFHDFHQRWAVALSSSLNAFTIYRAGARAFGPGHDES